MSSPMSLQWLCIACRNMCVDHYRSWPSTRWECFSFICCVSPFVFRQPCCKKDFDFQPVLAVWIYAAHLEQYFRWSLLRGFIILVWNGIVTSLNPEDMVSEINLLLKKQKCFHFNHLRSSLKCPLITRQFFGFQCYDTLTIIWPSKGVLYNSFATDQEGHNKCPECFFTLLSVCLNL